MTEAALQQTFKHLLTAWEGECVERMTEDGRHG
jgi:hypothetical protein